MTDDKTKRKKLTLSSSASPKSLDNLSLNSQTAHFKILKDSNYYAFSFKGGFEFLEIYFDSKYIGTDARIVVVSLDSI